MINNLGFKRMVTIPLQQDQRKTRGVQTSITIDTKNLVLREFSAEDRVTSPTVKIDTIAGEHILTTSEPLAKVKKVLGIKSKELEYGDLNQELIFDLKGNPSN